MEATAWTSRRGWPARRSGTGACVRIRRPPGKDPAPSGQGSGALRARILRKRIDAQGKETGGQIQLVARMVALREAIAGKRVA